MAVNNIHKSVKLARIIAINIAILCILLEVISSIAFYFFESDRFFYTKIKYLKDFVVEENFQEFSDSVAIAGFQIHPYLGFSVRGSSYKGFQTSMNLPYIKSSNEYIVAIFGGSVADEFLADEKIGRRELALKLMEINKIRDKKIVFLRVSSPAYKQPQQLISLNYLLFIGQEIDLAINIDGFNELTGAVDNAMSGVDFSFPSSIIFSRLADLANKNYSSDIASGLEIMRRRKLWMNAKLKIEQCAFASCYFLWKIKEKYEYDRYSKAMEVVGKKKYRKKTADSLVVTGRAEYLAEDKVLEKAVDGWYQASLMMHQLLAARGIPYFEFIQPNQYFKTAREFSANERAIAFTDDNAWGAIVQTGYPMLLSKIPILTGKGVEVFSAVDIFDDVPYAVYRDNLCHLNNEGNSILGLFIGESIKSRMLEQNTNPSQ